MEKMIAQYIKGLIDDILNFPSIFTSVGFGYAPRDHIWAAHRVAN